MQIHKNEKWPIYTNIFFILPIFVGVSNQNLGISILLVMMFLSSTYYHVYRKPGAEWWWETKGRNGKQTFSLILEITLALILSGWGMVLLFQKPLAIALATMIVFGFGFTLFLSTDYKKYPIYHSIWHAVSALTITVALL